MYSVLFEMIMKKLILVIIYCCFFVFETMSQNSLEIGSQLITNYSPKEYGANQQIWSIVQNESGIMYFGNQKGLLEFDGAGWRHYPMPNKSVVRSLANGDNGKIYVGAQGDLGYFLPDSLGRLTFHSLIEFVPKDKRDFSDVWNTYYYNGKVYFNAARYILIWDIQRKKFKILQSERGFHLISVVSGSLYVREWGKGLEVLTNDSLILLKGGDKFADERIYVLLPFPGEDSTILIVTRTMGFFKYDGNNFIPFKTEADKFIKENLIYFPGAILSDGNIVLGTVNGGAIVIDRTGKEIRKYTSNNGLASNTIYYTLQDRAGAIWLATDNGISRIDYASPVSYFDSRNNFSTIPNDIIRHNEIIYVATNSGVYYLDPQTSDFYKLKNSNNQSFAFLEIGNDLLVGTFNGLFKVEKDKLSAIRESSGNEYIVHVLKQSNINPNRIYVGAYGLWSLLKSDNGWEDEGQILNITDAVTSLIEENDGNLWISTNTSGVYRITFCKDGNGHQIISKPVIEHFEITNGLQNGALSVDNFNGVNYFSTADSIYKFDESSKKFTVDTSDKIISAFIRLADHKSLTVFQQDSQGRLWMGFENTLAMGTPQADGSYKWVTSPFKRFSDERIGRVYAEDNGIVWFLAGNSLIKYDFAKKNLNKTDYFALVRKVEIGSDSTIYFGGTLSKPIVPEIKFKNNSIKFKFSATSYEEKNANRYKTSLSGFADGWSSWSTENTKEYTNLPPGRYTFYVVAKNVIGIESSKASFSFVILAPWYRTLWAYLIYGLILIGGLFAADRMQRRRLVEKERKLSREKELTQAKEIEKAYKELKATQTQLVHAEKMASLGELTAGIAHEIQNPLNFVNNFAEVSVDLLVELKIEMENENRKEMITITDDLKLNLEKISQHGKRASSIVKGMLEHSRSGSGEKELTDINTLADEYLRLAYHGLRAKDKSFNVELKLGADENLPQVNVVHQEIGRVLLNLINNAFFAVTEKAKHNERGYKPLIEVTTKKLVDKIEIRVKDNGIGIPDSVKDKIFQPFFTTKPTGQGTGLGLSLSYDIITKGHGGELKFETKEGEGSEFIIELRY